MRSLLQLAPQIERSATQSSDRIPVLAFVADANTERVVKDHLTAQSTEGNVLRGGIADAVEHLRTERSPETLIVDLTGFDMPVSLVHTLAEECEPGTTVIAIGDQNEVGLYRDLLHAGVSDYIVKPLTPQLLAKSLHVITNPEAVSGQISQKLGKVIAVIGARGGVGSSTVATGLAWHLTEERHRRVVLIDLDLQSGSCGLLLNLKPASGLRDALDNPLRVDATLLERAMTAFSERLFVLNCEEPLTDEIQPTPEAIDTILSVLRPQFHYLIIDLPRIAAPGYRRVLEQADMRVIVADQTLHSARDALRLKQLLAVGDGTRQNMLVINRAGEGGRGGVTVDEIGNVAQLEPRAVIPYQPKLFNRAMIDGRSAASRHNSFSDAMASLASGLAGRTSRPRRRFWRS